ncbi:hypothetical protein SDC9_180796 [bioreactor metagenome]|uniref:Uncharacterized protein n=1 Tax=bioreactor metagenome TaxID=1076179 RepID=A0A645H2Q1_9ZZZZ
MVEHILQRPLLHNAARIHNGHLVAHLRHNAQIMRNHDHGGIIFLFEAVHKLQHLGLNGYIQGRCGLIGNEKLGVAGQGDGNDHPLLHAARKLMGIFIGAAGRYSNQLQHFAGPF